MQRIGMMYGISIISANEKESVRIISVYGHTVREEQSGI